MQFMLKQLTVVYDDDDDDSHDHDERRKERHGCSDARNVWEKLFTDNIMNGRAEF